MKMEEKRRTSKLLVLNLQRKGSVTDFGVSAGMDTRKILYDYLNCWLRIKFTGGICFVTYLTTIVQLSGLYRVEFQNYNEC